MNQAISAEKRDGRARGSALYPGLRSGKAVVCCAMMVVLLDRASGAVNPQVFPAEVVSARSHSGQFIVYAERVTGPETLRANVTTNREYFQLEPTLVTVSCERIKQAVSRDLGGSGSWRGKVYVTLHPARARGPIITITSERFKDGWQYRMDVPDLVERGRYVRAVVQVLMLELANREGRSRLAEVPSWLSEGLAERLLSSDQIEIILPPPLENVNGLNVQRTAVTELKTSPTEAARQRLGARPPLTFDQLSWQTAGDLATEEAEIYRASAALLVGELLRMPDGRDCLRTMLARSPQYQNWQFAFLEAFRAHFERLVDVEKWWALCLSAPTGGEVMKPWSAEESWERLDEVIRLPAQAWTGKTELAIGAEVTLQTVIRDWDRVKQNEVLTGKMRELSVLRARAAPELAVLVQEYSQALETYLQSRYRTSPIPRFGSKAARSRIVEETLQRLDALDARREALRPASAPVTAGHAAPQPAKP
jgi:hypothetical protein